MTGGLQQEKQLSCFVVATLVTCTEFAAVTIRMLPVIMVRLQDDLSSSNRGYHLFGCTCRYGAEVLAALRCFAVAGSTPKQ